MLRSWTMTTGGSPTIWSVVWRSPRAVVSTWSRRRSCESRRAPNPRPVIPPRSLRPSSFLVGNPGIQASNLACRLSVLLEAGLFDESLPSCTDRDLCIRISDLPGVRYGVTAHPTVHHFACRLRPRLSTPRSPARLAGLDGFFRKYQGRMSSDERERFRTRARRLFGWEESRPEPVGTRTAHDVSPAPAPPDVQPSHGRLHLIAGMIADTDRLEEVRGLLADLRDLAGNPGLSGLDVLVMENGRGRTADDALRALVLHERARGLRIHLVDRTRHLEDAAEGRVIDGGADRGRKLPIAHARTALQTYLYAFAKGRRGAVVWILDDGMRLDPLVAGKDGRLQRRPLDLVPMLQALRKRHASGDVDIAIGAYTGAPPLPFAATVRVQLVDLVASLQWLATQDPRAVLPDPSGENAALRSGRRDYYYDLSRSETDRLETPFRVTPAFPGERVGEAFERVAGAAERILAGEQVFRPLAIEPGPLEAGRRRTPAWRQHLRLRRRNAQARAQSLAGHRRAAEPALRHAVGAAATALLRPAGPRRTDCALPRPLPGRGGHAGCRARRGRRPGLRDVLGPPGHFLRVHGHG